MMNEGRPRLPPVRGAGGWRCSCSGSSCSRQWRRYGVRSSPPSTTKGQGSTVTMLKSRITIAAHKGACWFAIHSPDGKSSRPAGPIRSSVFGIAPRGSPRQRWPDTPAPSFARRFHSTASLWPVVRATAG